MSVSLVVMTDGRDDVLARTIASAREMLEGEIAHRIMHDDSGDHFHRRRLMAEYPDFAHIGKGDRRGFGGAYRHTFEWLDSNRAELADYVFLLEDDFTFNRPVELFSMQGVLERNPDVVQIALRRQAWSATERLAGGVIEQHPEAYAERRDHLGNAWLEHRLFFTTNPSMFRRTLCRREWPAGAQSEGLFGHGIIRDDPDAVFAYWGTRDDTPWVEHIGDERAGKGY